MGGGCVVNSVTVLHAWLRVRGTLEKIRALAEEQPIEMTTQISLLRGLRTKTKIFTTRAAGCLLPHSMCFTTHQQVCNVVHPAASEAGCGGGTIMK
jgi:hypothetical protein